MDPFGRVMMAGLAAFMIWTLVRGVKTGVLYSEGWALGAERSPVMFALDFAVRSVLIVMCLGMAAGYTLAEEEQFGLMLLTIGR